MRYVLVTNCQFIHNHVSGVILSGTKGKNSNITISNNIIINNGSGNSAWPGLWWANPGAGSSYSGNAITGNGTDIVLFK